MAWYKKPRFLKLVGNYRPLKVLIKMISYLEAILAILALWIVNKNIYKIPLTTNHFLMIERGFSAEASVAFLRGRRGK